MTGDGIAVDVSVRYKNIPSRREYSMEYADIITQVISTVGFPIAMCVLMFWFLNKEQETHKSEMNELKEVIAKNNEVLASLKQLIADKLA